MRPPQAFVLPSGQSMTSILTPSRYNHPVAMDDGRLLVANLLSRRLVTLSPEDAAAWRSGLDGLSKEAAEALQAAGTLVAAGTDELAAVERAYQTSQLAQSRLQITIALTLDCNLRCHYCYENRTAEYLTPEAEEDLAAMVERLLPSRDYLVVTWYGGEPLMRLDAIERLTARFLSLCARHGAHYKAMMVTNGLLLDHARVDRLACLGYWTQVQVTLDGPRDCHDARRPRAGGRPTFDRIVSNLTHACDRLPIKLRVNVDSANIGRVTELVDHLAEHGLAGKLSLYLSAVHDIGTGCRDLEATGPAPKLDSRTLAAAEPAILQYMRERGFGATKPSLPVISCNCQAVQPDSVLVGPDGATYRCWLDVGKPEHRVGSLDEPFCLNDPGLVRWLRHNPTQATSCRDCKVLPICLGNCPRMHLDGYQAPERCPPIRFNLDEFVIRQYARQGGELCQPAQN
jgi:uncharacterized protein